MGTLFARLNLNTVKMVRQRTHSYCFLVKFYEKLFFFMKIKAFRPYIGILLGAFALLTRWILGFYPEIIENGYSRGIYIGIRYLLDFVQGILPFSCLYLLIGFLIFKIITGLKWWITAKKTIAQKFLNTIISILNLAGWVIFLFLFLWGFNYGRVDFAKQLGLDLKPLKTEEIKATLNEIEPLLIAARNEIPNHQDSTSFTSAAFPENMKANLLGDLEKQLEKLGYPDVGKPRLRMGYPKGLLRGFGAIGFYNPLTGECNVDPGIHPIDEPYVVAHEYSHAYGFGDEGVCNFLAYLTCLDSKDPFVRYAGIFNYWQYLYYALGRADRKAFNEYYQNLPIAIKTDIQSIDENSEKYPHFFPQSIQRATYDAYLKSQGVKDGFASYSQILMLVKAWKEKG